MFLHEYACLYIGKITVSRLIFKVVADRIYNLLEWKAQFSFVCGHFSIILYAHRRIGNRGFGKIIIHAQKVFIFSVRERPHSVLSRFCYQRETYVSLHVTISERDFCLGKQMPHYRFILVIELLGNT